MLSLYYKDLFTAQEMSVKYLDLNCEAAIEATNNGCDPDTIKKMNSYFKAHKMWSEKYNKLEGLKWYQRLFYKRES